LRRLLLSADRFSDAAIALGSLLVNTPLSSVSASLCSVTACDQRRPAPRRFDAVAFLATARRLGMGHSPRRAQRAEETGGSSIIKHGGEACTGRARSRRMDQFPDTAQ
jgi:hypothetical protein